MHLVKEAHVRSYRDLLVWKKSVTLATNIYALTKKFPKEEMYGLTSQLRRCAVSVPSNIAEGSSRRSNGDFVRFVNIAFGSLAEIETQCFIAQELGYISSEENEVIYEGSQEIGRMPHSLQSKLIRKREG